MPRIFWTPGRKRRLVHQAQTMSVAQLAKAHFQPVAEIERMLKQLSPDNPLIKEIRKEHGVKITIFYPGYAEGVQSQRVHARHLLY